MSDPVAPEVPNPYAAPNAVNVPSQAMPLPDDASIRQLFERGKNGAAWFYWIAALSLVNTVMILTEGGMAFALGLNLTIIPDSIAAGIALKPGGNRAILVAALLFDAFILGMFAFCGYLSQRRVLSIYALGMVIYLLDGLVGLALLGFADFIGIGIHAFALWSMWSGFQAYRQINRLQRQAMDSAIANGV
jgi:hypothetical protein